MKQSAWAITETRTGNLVLLSGQCPIYWHRKVAYAAAKSNGLLLTTSRGVAAFSIVRVQIVSAEAPPHG